MAGQERVASRLEMPPWHARRARGFARSRSSERVVGPVVCPGESRPVLRIPDVTDGCFPPGLPRFCKRVWGGNNGNEDPLKMPSSFPLFIFWPFPVLQRKPRFVSSSFPVSFPFVSRFLPIGGNLETNASGERILPAVFHQPPGFDSLPRQLAHSALTHAHLAGDVLGAGQVVRNPLHQDIDA